MYDYTHAQGGCSVTGGVVYRGARYPALYGQYFFSDFCLGGLRALTGAPGAAQVREVLPANLVSSPSTFGIAPEGEMYVASLTSGTLYLLRQSSTTGDAIGDGVPDGQDHDPFDRMNPIPDEALPSRSGWRAILDANFPRQ